MTVLRLGLGSAGASAGDIQASAEVLDARLRVVWRGPIEIGAVAEIEVEPGLYAARAYFPSGDVVQGDISIEDDRDVDLELSPPGGGEEPSARDVLAGVPSPPPHRAVRGLGFRGEEERTASYWARIWLRQGGGWLPGPAPEFHWVDRQSHHAELILGQGQRLLQLGGGDVSWRLVSLPPTGPGLSSDVWVSITTDALGEEDLGVVVASRNHRAEALLRFLVGGSLRQATVVSEAVVGGGVTAEALLMGKLTDPAAATVGAYYLLRVGELERLHDWARNLAAWITWMADGPVIYAWQLLRTHPVDLAEARTQLLEAARRGLPTYTEGLRLLHDGLKLFDAREQGRDREVAVALNVVSAYAAAADRSAPTTTFGGVDPDRPSLRPVLGEPEDLEAVAWVVP